jgi:hypothetical protein
MGPEILIAFFMFLGLLFWGMVRAIWWLLKKILNFIFIPWMFITNYIRTRFWGLPKREKGNDLF